MLNQPLQTKICLGSSVALALLTLLTILYWHYVTKGDAHPIAKALLKFDNDSNAKNWQRVANAIDNEYCRIDKFSVALGGALMSNRYSFISLLLVPFVQLRKRHRSRLIVLVLT